MWHVIRSTYFETEKSTFICETIAPALQSLRPVLGEPRLFLRAHWKRGPHVDIVVDCEDGAFEAAFPPCRDALQEWLDRHPSGTVLDEGAYEAQSNLLGVMELESGPFTPLYTNNSVFRASYDSRRDIHFPEVVEAKEEFLVATHRDVLALCEEKRRQRVDCYLLLAAMMTSAAQLFHDGGAPRGVISFRSHAEAFFASMANSDDVRRQFVDRENKFRDALDSRLRPILEDRAPSSLDGWRAALAKAKARIDAVPLLAGEEERLREGYFDKARGIAAGTSLERPNWTPPGSKMTEFFEAHGARPFWSRPEYRGYRMILNFFYLLLPVASISSFERYFLAFAVANAVERISGRSWRDVLQEAVVTGASGP